MVLKWKYFYNNKIFMNKYTLLVILVIASLAPTYKTSTDISADNTLCTACAVSSTDWICGTAIGGTGGLCCTTGDEAATGCVASDTVVCTSDSDLFPDDTSKYIMCVTDGTSCAEDGTTDSAASEADTYTLIEDYTTELAADSYNPKYAALGFADSCYYTMTPSGTDVRRYSLVTTDTGETDGDIVATVYTGSLTAGFVMAKTIVIASATSVNQGFSVASGESAYLVLVPGSDVDAGTANLQTFETTITAKEAASTTCTSSSDDGLSGGAIAGIVIGCVAFVGLAGVGVFVAVKLLCKPAK